MQYIDSCSVLRRIIGNNIHNLAAAAAAAAVAAAAAAAPTAAAAAAVATAAGVAAAAPLVDVPRLLAALSCSTRSHHGSLWKQPW